MVAWETKGQEGGEAVRMEERREGRQRKRVAGGESKRGEEAQMSARGRRGRGRPGCMLDGTVLRVRDQCEPTSRGCVPDQVFPTRVPDKLMSAV